MLAWFRDRILPVTHSIADRWGMLDGLSQLRGTPLEMADGMIAATSLEHDLTVVSRNVRDFARLGLGLTSSEGAASEITRLSFRQTSMLTQRLHRIDIRGATSRQTQRDSGNQGEQQRDSAKGNWICGCDTEQQAGNKAGQNQRRCEAERDPGRHHDSALP